MRYMLHSIFYHEIHPQKSKLTNKYLEVGKMTAGNRFGP